MATSKDTSTATLKDLRVVLNVYKRSLKDLSFYEKEKAAQLKRIEKLIDEKADESSIKKQREVLEETEVMLPDCRQRIQKALQDLKNFLAANEGNEDLQGHELLQEAKTLAESAGSQ